MTRHETIAANPLAGFLVERGYELRPAGKNFVTNACPMAHHKKHHRPTTIDTVKDLWHCNDCKCGGSVIDWLIIEKHLSAAEAMRMLGGQHNGSKLAARLVKTYDYVTESGELLFQCCRYEPKDFKQRQPDGRVGWLWNLQGTRRVLYRLPELLRDLKRGLPVIVTEGEKDADEIAKLGLPLAVTCNPLGAGKWRDEYSQTLRGASVFVIADKDEAGRKHAQEAAALLHGKTKSVAILELPDRNGQKVKDASDWLAAGGTAGELTELLNTAQEWTPQTRTLAVDLAAALHSICTFLQRYVVFQMPEQSQAIALWIAHSWVVDAFDYTPYLHVTNPEKQCAKTRLLDCLELVTPKSWRAVLPSEAVLFRKIEKDRPTLLLDELDGVFSVTKDDRKEALRSLLNAGFEAKATIPRCVGQGANQEAKDFAVFCPKALAGIGKLPDTVRDRAVQIQLVRRSRDEKVERFRKREAEKEASVIRAVLEAWAKQLDIIEKLREARPSLPDALSDRQQDICEPLLAIAEMAAGEWPERARVALVALCSQGDDDESLGVKVLSAIRQIFDVTQCDKIATQDLLQDLVDQETDAPWASWWEADLKNHNTRGPAQKLARLLKPYKIIARVIRLPDDSTPRGYRREDFLEAWKRYLPANGRNNATTQQSGELYL